MTPEWTSRASTTTWVLLLIVMATPAAAQQGRYSGPQPPGVRIVSTSEDCAKLQKEWDDYKNQWGQQHTACLNANNDSRIPGSGPCSKAPCLQLHYMIFEYASAESSRMLDQCRAVASRNAKIRAEHEAAVRKYNEQVAEQNRQLLAAINQQNAEIAEQNRRAQEAVEERNRAAQQVFEDLMRQYNLPSGLSDRTGSTLQAMRDALRAGGDSPFTNQVSNLVDEFGAITFDDAVNDVAEAAATFGSVFDAAHATLQLDPPERATSVLENIDRFAAAWNIFQAGRAALSDSATAQDRFNSQITVLSTSTSYLFQNTPWAAPIVADNIEGIGRWANSTWKMFDDTLNGAVISNDQIKETFLRDLFPRFMWLNDRITQVQGTANQLGQLFGR